MNPLQLVSAAAAWLLAGIAVTALHVARYPHCCHQHPELKADDTHDRIRISKSLHAWHVFCRFVFNSVCVVMVIAVIPILVVAWLPGLCLRNRDREPSVAAVADATNICEPKRVAVIGAGPSGLVTAKYLLQHGHKVTIFEKSHQIGGAFSWSYSGVLTSSNFLTAFSDLDIAAEDLTDSDALRRERRIEMGTFLTFPEYCAYLERYCRAFKLSDCIRFNCAVRRISFDAVQRQWSLSTETPNEETHIFDHIAVCTGIAQTPNLPELMETRGGIEDGIEVIHSSAFRGASDSRIQGANVLIIGCGESGSDISLIVSRAAEKSYLSTRGGPGYLIPRFFGGAPEDRDTSRVYYATREWGLSPPIRFKRWMENFWISPTDDLRVLGEAARINAQWLQRGYSPFNKFGTKSLDFVRARVYHGLQWKPSVRRIDWQRQRVEFEDGSEMAHCDLIICATGYRRDQLAIFDIDHDEGEALQVRQLFEGMFSVAFREALCFIGINRPMIGTLPPLSEMSARYFALVVSGLKKLPTKEQMRRRTTERQALRKRQFPNHYDTIPVLCDFLTKYDALAQLIGCENDLWQLFWTRPFMWFQVLTKSLRSAQFNLRGPHKHDNAELLWRTLSRPPAIAYPVLFVEFVVYAAHSLIAAVRKRAE